LSAASLASPQENPPLDVNSRLELAIDLARRAGDLLRGGYGHAGAVRYKGPIDPVTEYDLRSEALIRDSLSTAFPEDSVLGEEGGGSGQGHGRWLVDPLDGTVNFAHTIPIFAVSLAYTLGDRPVLGVTYDPMRDELFHATAGGGAWLNGERLRVSEVEHLDRGLLVTGFPYDIRSAPNNNLGHYAAFAMRSLGVRRLGSASLDLAYVASGRFDGYWEYAVEAWDIGAGILLVEEAGGRVTRADGQPNPLQPPASILATNARLHPAMLAVLSGGEGSS
jgi:myo-inositol-1(or 4)-monophosphatase